MTREEFISEVKSSSICPADFDKIYDDFTMYQQKAMDTLNEFHRVCEKNNVNYQLAYGSLLGLIRDGGQIPWDYDVDVFVPYEEKWKLIEALKKDLNEDFYFYCPENNDKCRHVIMRLAPKGYRSEALHVDVFYLTGTPAEAKEKENHKAQIIKTSQARFYKLVDIFDEGKGHPKIMLQLIAGRILNLFASVRKAYQQYDMLCRKYAVSDSEVCISADSFADSYEFPTKYILETKLISSAYGQFRIPVYYEELLAIMYGDYKTVPPLKSRLRELLTHYERLSRYASVSKKNA